MREAKRRKVKSKKDEGQELRTEIKGIMLRAGINKVIIPYDINNDKQRTRSKSATDTDCQYSVNITIKKIKGKDEVFITDSCPRLGVNRGEYITDEILDIEKEYYDKQIIPKLEVIIEESEGKFRQAVSGLVKLSKSR